jgi:hypothetical protein
MSGRSSLRKQHPGWQQSHQQGKHPHGTQSSHRQESDYTAHASPDVGWKSSAGSMRALLVATAGKEFERLKRKTKRPRLCLSLGTYVDQPSPKCCSKTRLSRVDQPVYGPSVPCRGTNVVILLRPVLSITYATTGTLLTPTVPNTRR